MTKNHQRKSSEPYSPPLPNFYDRCGGLSITASCFMKKQLDFKKDLLKQALTKFKPKGYQKYILKRYDWHGRTMALSQQKRNFSCDMIQNQNEIEAGLYEMDSHRLVAIDDCLVQEKATQDVINGLVQLLNKYQLPIYDERKNSGILRTLMVRVGRATGEVQVVFITNSSKLPQKNALIREINQRMPQVVSIMQNVQSKKTSVIMGG